MCLFCSPLLAALFHRQCQRGLRASPALWRWRMLDRSTRHSSAVPACYRELFCSSEKTHDNGDAPARHCLTLAGRGIHIAVVARSCLDQEIGRKLQRPHFFRSVPFSCCLFLSFLRFWRLSFLVGHYILITIRFIFFLCRLQKALSTGQSHIPRRAEGPQVLETCYIAVPISRCRLSEA